MTTVMIITGAGTSSTFDPMKFIYRSFTDVCETAVPSVTDAVLPVPMMPKEIGTPVATVVTFVADVPELAHTFNDIEPEELRNIPFFLARDRTHDLPHSV